MDLSGYDLRYLLTSSILDHGGSATTSELRRAVTELGVGLGPDPRRRLYGALRSEVRKGRLRPLGEGRYEIADLPRSTRSHIRRRATVIRRALADGARWPPPQDRYVSPAPAPPATRLADGWPVVRSLEDLRHPSGQRLRDA